MRRLVIACFTVLGVVLQVTPAQPEVVQGPQLKQAAQQVRLTPFELVKLAGQDAANSGPLASYYRYLPMPSWPAAYRVKLKQTVDWVLNSLSQRQTIVRTGAIPSEDDPRVLKVDLNAYGIEPKAWDELVEKGSGSVPLNEPYYYISVEAEVVEYFPAGTENGKKYDAGNYKVRKKTVATAPWVATDGGKVMADLIKALSTPKYTCRAPVIRADWFVSYASWAPAYYKLLGIKERKEKEFESLCLLDIERATKSLVAAVADTKLVTLHNRILTRYATVSGRFGGSFWASWDTDLGLDKENYLLNLNKFDRPVFKAKELIGSLPNGLQTYAVANNKAELLDLAQVSIARHSNHMPTRLEDVQIFTGLRNCAFCHYGLQKIDCRVRALAQGDVGLAALLGEDKSDIDLLNRFTDAFSVDVNTFVDHDSARYALAVQACNGLEAKQNSTQFEVFCWEYLDKPLTLAEAAVEAGCTEEEIVAVARASVGIDTTIVALTKNPPISVNRIDWERRGFPQLMLALTTRPKVEQK